MSKYFSQRGQVALVVLLISAVVLTIGLSLSKRAVTETKIDTDEELLKQAFNAAESGIEYYLGTGSTAYQAVGSSMPVSANITTQNIGGGTTLDFDETVLANNTSFYWMMAHDGAGNLNLTSYYGGTGPALCVADGFNQSLKVDYFYYDTTTTTYRVKRYGYNVGGGTAVAGYTAINPANGSCSARSNYKYVPLGSIGANERPIVIAVKPVGVGVKMLMIGAGSSFPVQGEKISSTGHAGDVSAQGVSQKVSVMNQYRIPEFMIDAISGSNVLSN